MAIAKQFAWPNFDCSTSFIQGVPILLVSKLKNMMCMHEFCTTVRSPLLSVMVILHLPTSYEDRPAWADFKYLVLIFA